MPSRPCSPPIGSTRGDVAVALGKAASSIFAVLEATQAMGERELQLVAAQDRLVSPPRRFTRREAVAPR